MDGLSYHDLDNLTGSCQVEEIRVDRRFRFASVADALALGCDRCAYCFRPPSVNAF